MTASRLATRLPTDGENGRNDILALRNVIFTVLLLIKYDIYIQTNSRFNSFFSCIPIMLTLNPMKQLAILNPFHLNNLSSFPTCKSRLSGTPRRNFTAKGLVST